MAVKIRLKRLGKVRVPQYRIVVVDSRKKRDGRVIEEIGKYHPKEEPSLIDVSSDRAQYWLGEGAQPTDTVQTLLSVTGDWQKFKGLPGTEGRLRTAGAKRDKLEIFNEALKEAGSEGLDNAPADKRPAKKAASKAADKAADKPAEDKAADKAAEDKPADKAAEKAAEDKPADKAAEKPAEDKPAEIPSDETPEGATADAEAEETKAVDAEKKAEPEDGASS